MLFNHENKRTFLPLAIIQILLKTLYKVKLVRLGRHILHQVIYMYLYLVYINVCICIYYLYVEVKLSKQMRMMVSREDKLLIKEYKCHL